MNHIIYRLNDGLVDLLFQTNSNVLKNQLIFSYASGEFYDRYKTEGGSVYFANTRLKKDWIYYRRYLLVFSQRSLLITI